MKLIKKAAFVGLLTFLTHASVTQADTIDQYINGPWLMFGWASWLGEDAVGCAPADPDGLSCTIYGDEVAAPASPWAFTAPTGWRAAHSARCPMVS